MDQVELERFRTRLHSRRQQLAELQATGAAAAGAVELDQARVGRLSRMDAMQAQQMAADAGRRRQQELQDIAAALARIDAGDYGWCEQCGEDINVRRLEIAPTARLCMPCAQRGEQPA